MRAAKEFPAVVVSVAKIAASPSVRITGSRWWPAQFSEAPIPVQEHIGVFDCCSSTISPGCRRCKASCARFRSGHRRRPLLPCRRSSTRPILLDATPSMLGSAHPESTGSRNCSHSRYPSSCSHRMSLRPSPPQSATRSTPTPTTPYSTRQCMPAVPGVANDQRRGLPDSRRRGGRDQGRGPIRCRQGARAVHRRAHPARIVPPVPRRVFSDGAESEWGGTGILARIPTARATRDVDLFRSGYPLDTALADLRRLAAIDLHDHFRFEYVSHQQSIGGDAQPYTDGYRVSFAVFVGANAHGTLNVDLASGAGLTAEVIRSEPASALHLPRLISYPFRLYPVVDQIADKVCATLADYGRRPSTREKDLVDLVAFTTTHDIDGDALSVALASEIRRRRLPHPDRFMVPVDWAAATQGWPLACRHAPAIALLPTRPNSPRG